MPDTHKRKTILKEVAIALIWPNPENPRSYDDPEAVKELMTNMDAVGQRTPVKMVPLTEDEKAGITLKDGIIGSPTEPIQPNHGPQLGASAQVCPYQFKLLGGHLRRKAAINLGWETLDALILDLTPEEAELEMILDNRISELPWLDQYKIIERQVNKNPGTPQEVIAQRIKVDQSDISRAMKTLKYLNPASREMIYAIRIKSGGDVEAGKWLTMAITDIEDPEKVEKSLKFAFDNQLTIAKAKGLVAWVKAGNPPETYTGHKTPKAPKPKPAPGPSPEALDKFAELAEQVGVAKGRGEDPTPAQEQLKAYRESLTAASPSQSPVQEPTFKITSPEGFALLKQKIGDMAKEVFKPSPKVEAHIEKEAQKGLKWSEKLAHGFVKHVWHKFIHYEHRFCKEMAKLVVPEHYTHSGHKGKSRGLMKDLTTLALTLLHWTVYAVCQFVFWWGLPTWALSRFLPSLKPWFEWPFRFAVRQVLAFPPWAWVWGTNHLFPALVLLAVVLVLISLAARVEPMRMTLLGVLLASTLYYGPRWANVPSPWSQPTEEVSTPVPQTTPVIDEVKQLVSISKPKEKPKSTSAPVVAYQPSTSFITSASPSDSTSTTTLYDPKLLEQEIAALPKNCIVKSFPVLTDEGMPGDLAVSRMQGVTDPDKYTMMIGSGKQQIQSINTTTTNLVINYKSTDPLNMFNGPGQLNYFWEDVLYIHTDEIDVEGKTPYTIYQLSLVVSGSKYALTIQCASQADLKHLVSTMQYFIRNSRLGHDTALAGMPYPHQGLVLNNDGVVDKLWANSPMDKAAVSLGDHFWSIGKVTSERQGRSDLEAGLSTLPVTFYYATASEWDRAMQARNPNLASSFRPRLRKVVLNAI